MHKNKFDIKEGYLQYAKLFALIINWTASDIDDKNTKLTQKITIETVKCLLSESSGFINNSSDKVYEININFHYDIVEKLAFFYYQLFNEKITIYSYPEFFEFDVSRAAAILKDMCYLLLVHICNLVINQQIIINRYENYQSKDITKQEAMDLLGRLRAFKGSKQYGMIFITPTNHQYKLDSLLAVAKRCNAAPEYILTGYLYNHNDSYDYEDQMRMDVEEEEYLNQIKIFNNSH